VLKPDIKAYFLRLLPTLLEASPGVSLEAIGFDLDHLHMVLTIPPKYAVSDVVGRLKSQSASRLRKKFAWLGKVYWDDPGVVWSEGYYVSSVGLNEAQIKSYVKKQGRRDANAWSA
jgi:putative transposase